MTDIDLPDLRDTLLGSPFGTVYDCGYEQPNHTSSETSGDGSVTFDELGLTLSSDSADGDATLKTVQFANAVPSMVFYYNLNHSATDIGDSGTARIGGRAFVSNQGAEVDLINNEVNVEGETEPISITFDRAVQIWIIIDHQNNETIFYLRSITDSEVIELPTSPNTTRQECAGYVEDGEHTIVINEFGRVPLWEVPFK